jgi:hypothetical protein
MLSKSGNRVLGFRRMPQFRQPCLFTGLALYTVTSSLEDYFLVKEDICDPLIFHQMKS